MGNSAHFLPPSFAWGIWGELIPILVIVVAFRLYYWPVLLELWAGVVEGLLDPDDWESRKEFPPQSPNT